MSRKVYAGYIIHKDLAGGHLNKLVDEMEEEGQKITITPSGTNSKWIYQLWVNHRDAFENKKLYLILGSQGYPWEEYVFIPMLKVSQIKKGVPHKVHFNKDLKRYVAKKV